jgi:hypothetical protein
MCALLDEGPAEHGHLADELLRWADPWFMPGLDAPIPAHRHDLARNFLFARMVGLVATGSDRAAFL